MNSSNQTLPTSKVYGGETTTIRGHSDPSLKQQIKDEL